MLAAPNHNPRWHFVGAMPMPTVVRLACCEMDVLFLKLLPSMKLTAIAPQHGAETQEEIHRTQPSIFRCERLFQGGYLNGMHGTGWYIHLHLPSIKIKHKYTNVPLVCVGLLIDPESYPETKQILVGGIPSSLRCFFQVAKFAELVDSGQTDFHIFHIFQGLKTKVMRSRRVPHN